MVKLHLGGLLPTGLPGLVYRPGSRHPRITFKESNISGYIQLSLCSKIKQEQAKCVWPQVVMKVCARWSNITLFLYYYVQQKGGQGF